MKIRELIKALKNKPLSLSLVYLTLFSLFTLLIIKYQFLKTLDQSIAQPTRPFYTTLRYYTLMIPDNYGLRWVSFLPPFMVSITLIVKKRNLKPLFLTLLALFLDNGLTGLIKYIFNRSKPSSLHSEFFTESYHSYPSGHLVNIILMYSLTLYLLKKYSSIKFERLKVYYFLNGLMAVTFFITSLLRNTHWLTDLFGSLLLAPSIFYLLRYIDSKINLRIKR